MAGVSTKGGEEMKRLKRTMYKQEPYESDVEITRVIHGLPTWMFPDSEFVGHIKTPCPVCRREMPLIIGHGEIIEECSFIQLKNGETMPIHTECYNQIKEIKS